MPKRTTRDQDGIYRRPDSPAWWCSYTVGSRTARRSTGILIDADPRGHQARIERAKLMAAAGVAAAPTEPAAAYTWDRLINLYLDGPGGRKAPATIRRDRFALKHLYPACTGRALESINGAFVRSYVAARQEEGAAAASIAAEVALMSAAVNWAIQDLEWAVANPWAKRKPRVQNARTRTLTHEEARRLLDAAGELGEQDRRAGHLPDFIRLCLYAGLRPGEALGLEWDRVDLARGMIGFGAEDQKNRKTGAIPINREARAAILSRQRARVAGSPWVFAHPDGRRIGDVKKSFASAAKAAGLEDIHPHDLRRTFGTWLDQAGVPIQQISRLLRHSGVEITHQVYAHARTETLADAVGLLDGNPPRLRVVSG